MSSVRNSALGLVITAFALLSPIVAFLVRLAAEMLIDLQIEEVSLEPMPDAG